MTIRIERSVRLMRRSISNLPVIAVTACASACAQIAPAGRSALAYQKGMTLMKLRSFVMAAAAAICMPLLAVHGVDVAAAETQIIKSQSLGKEVAAALQQEQQASQLAAQGRAEEAETLYKESLAIIEKSLPGDPILAGSLNNLAQFYRTRRRLPEAAELFNRALAIYVARYGDNHTLTATVINNLAGTYLSESRFDAAEPLYRRGLAASEKLLGPEHYGVAISLDWLAQTSFHQKRYPEAESQLRRGIAIAEKATGPDSQLVVRLLDHMISAVKAQGREQEAAALKERAQLIIAKSRK